MMRFAAMPVTRLRPSLLSVVSRGVCATPQRLHADARRGGDGAVDGDGEPRRPPHWPRRPPLTAFFSCFFLQRRVTRRWTSGQRRSSAWMHSPPTSRTASARMRSSREERGAQRENKALNGENEALNGKNKALNGENKALFKRLGEAEDSGNVLLAARLKEMIERNDKAIERNNKPIEDTRKAIEDNRKAIERNDETIKRNNQLIDENRAIIKRKNSDSAWRIQVCEPCLIACLSVDSAIVQSSTPLDMTLLCAPPSEVVLPRPDEGEPPFIPPESLARAAGESLSSNGKMGRSAACPWHLFAAAAGQTLPQGAGQSSACSQTRRRHSVRELQRLLQPSALGAKQACGGTLAPHCICSAAGP